MGTMPHTVHFSSAYLPKAENKESKQEQPSQDTAGAFRQQVGRSQSLELGNLLIHKPPHR